MLTVGSLFSGIGGFDLGFERAGFKVKWQVEKDEWCKKILTKHWPNIPKFGDVKEVGAHNLGAVDVICGGFPCQPFSTAGKRKGKEDDRYLWPEMLRIISELQPCWVVGENVAGLVSMGLDDCLSDLENQGYETQAFIIPACAVNAPHRRDRVWIVAHSKSIEDRRRTGKVQGANEQQEEKRQEKRIPELGGSSQISHITQDSKCNGRNIGEYEKQGSVGVERNAGSRSKVGLHSKKNVADNKDKRIKGRQRFNWWDIEPTFCRIFNELPEGLDKDRLTKSQRHGNMGLNDKGEYHAKTKNTRPRKILQSLQEEDAPEKIQPRDIGGLDKFQKKETLQSTLYGGGYDTRQTYACGIKEKSDCFKRGCLRILWNNGKFEYPPHGFKPSEQRKIELKNTLRFLSYLMALDSRQTQRFAHEQAFALQNLRQGISEIKTGYVPETLSEIQKIWESSSNEEKDWLTLRVKTGNSFHSEWPDTPRVAHGVCRRVDRLKELGNAVVPQVVEVIASAIREIEEA